MKVYKFGGASVRTADGVRNLENIVRGEKGLFVIVSAMGKTTNALERMLDRFMEADRTGARKEFEEVKAYHDGIIADLFGAGFRLPEVDARYREVESLLAEADPAAAEYELWYDRTVSYGELISTAIIAAYLNRAGIPTKWIDMRRTFLTDGRHKDANIDIEASAPLLKAETAGPEELFIGQGFIGGAPDGEPSTLGREGSDYSAAVAANILDAESMSVWKDVEGILNADPKIFPDTEYIPQLTYIDAIELAYSGAQIIHPKTIKPLQNKSIPLYVRPFGDKSKPGTVIRAAIDRPVSVPILILKRNQILVSVRPDDLSFMMEERMSGIFALLEQYRIKTNLVQSSAVNLSLCIDASRHLPQVVERLHSEGFRVKYNDNLELLTIRGYDARMLARYVEHSDVYLSQKTRRTVRIVRPRSL